MKTELFSVDVAIADGVTVSYEKGMLTAKGPKGEVTKKLLHPKVDFKIADGNVTISAKNATKREKMNIHSYRAHVTNVIEGAANGFVYELKICSGHFPMSASVKGNNFELKNFLGESVARNLTLKEGVEVKVAGEIITVESSNKELAGQVAADLEQLTRITNRDRRIFQDGIYITKKAGKDLVA
jgi:large subunit ribosomal protein L6